MSTLTDNGLDKILTHTALMMKLAVRTRSGDPHTEMWKEFFPDGGYPTNTMMVLPPEPVRYLGAKLVRAAVRRKTRLEDQGERVDAVTETLAGLVPVGLTPRPERKDL